MKPIQTNRRPLRKYLGYAAAIALTLVLTAAAFVEWRYGVFIPTLRSAPPYDPATAGAVIVVDPSKIRPLLPELIAPAAGFVPGWLLGLAIPYHAGSAATLDMDGRNVSITGYLNARRFAPLIARESAKANLSDAAPHIQWAGHPFEGKPGLFVASGSIPFDPDAEATYATMWDQSIAPKPLEPEGGHFIEGFIDNRRGRGYLILASFIKAYNIDLTRNEHDISIASLQFMREAHFTADFAPPNSINLKLVLDIAPDAIDRIGVVNLKVGIEESITTTADRWKRENQLDLTGASRWENNTIVYEYKLADAKKFLALIRDGDLN